MPSGLLNLVERTVKNCDDSYHDLLASSAQEVDSASLDLVKETLVSCQREARKRSFEVGPKAEEPFGAFLDAVRSADTSRRVLAGLVGNRDEFTRRRSASAAAKDLQAMEDRFDKFMKDLDTVIEQGAALRAVLQQPQARVQRRGEIKMVIDDEAG